MLLYYIRHADPIYRPDSITPYGEEQARVLADRLERHPFDRVYASTSNRAIQTATPICQRLGLEPILLDFANEKHAWKQMTVEMPDGRRWFYNDMRLRYLFTLPEVRKMGFDWYKHPLFADYDFGAGIQRVQTEVDAWLKTLGYEHIPGTARYRVLRPNGERVGFFAHAGFGSLFMSCLLDLPYPLYCATYDMCTTGVSVIDFREHEEWAIPVLMTFSNDGHLYGGNVDLSYHY
ncbi:MAG: histidine phosphatase family protein [Clostridia bacterium]|nr:histidine phosphatase family protein [Clostridia bacterium]